MRRLLYAIACCIAAFALLALALTVVTGPTVADLAGVVLFLLIALALSAPFELAPPVDREGFLLFAVPGWFAVAWMVLRGVIWVGDKVLLGVWRGVFAVWDRRRSRLAAG